MKYIQFQLPASPSFSHLNRQGAGNLLYKIASTKLSKTNVTRNLRRCIRDAGAAIQVEVELVRTTIRLRKPRSRVIPIYWPILSMKNWCEVLMRKYPKVLLGGYNLEQESDWKSLFRWFWEAFYQDDPTHPIFTCDDWDPSCAIPYMTHGDEGKGLRNQPFMVQSWQTVVSIHGPGETNMSGYLKFKSIYVFFVCMVPNPLRMQKSKQTLT